MNFAAGKQWSNPFSLTARDYPNLNPVVLPGNILVFCGIDKTMNYYNSENWYFDFSDKDATKAAWKMGNYLPVLDFFTGGGSDCVDQDN